MQFYLKVGMWNIGDVAQLADVFEGFRCRAIETYRLDPAYYVSAPYISNDEIITYFQ